MTAYRSRAKVPCAVWQGRPQLIFRTRSRASRAGMYRTRSRRVSGSASAAGPSSQKRAPAERLHRRTIRGSPPDQFPAPVIRYGGDDRPPAGEQRCRCAEDSDGKWVVSSWVAPVPSTRTRTLRRGQRARRWVTQGVLAPGRRHPAAARAWLHARCKPARPGAACTRARLRRAGIEEPPIA
jgi:hypothetical protein